MDKLLELATSSLPAWLILLLIAVWLVAGRELVDRVFNRNERRVARKKAEIDLARLEFEQEKLSKEARESGLILPSLPKKADNDRWKIKRLEVLKYTGGMIIGITVFITLPVLAQITTNADGRKHILAIVISLFIVKSISVLWPLLLRDSVHDGFNYSLIAFFYLYRYLFHNRQSCEYF